MIKSIAHYQQIYQQANQLYSKDQVLSALGRVADEITTDLADKNPVLLCVMTGGVVMMGHLLTRLIFPLQLDYIHASRYRGETTGGALSWIAKPTMPLSNREVLIVDDILDEGITLKVLSHYCYEHGAKRVQSAVLVNKRHERKVNYQPGFIGLHVEDRYVFGFGMDYHGYWRNAPGIYAVNNL